MTIIEAYMFIAMLLDIANIKRRYHDGAFYDEGNDDENE
jgi:hypothetical protein